MGGTGTVLFYNGLLQERVASLGELGKGRRVPGDRLVQGVRWFLDLSGLLT